MEVVPIRLEAIRLAALSHEGPYETIRQTFEKLSRAGLPSGPLVAVYYDDPHVVPPADLRSEAGVVVAEDFRIQGDLHQVVLPAGQYAKAAYAGPYEGLPGAWEEFYMRGIPAAGLHTRQDLCFEKYLNTPLDTRPEDLVTELYAPLA